MKQSEILWNDIKAFQPPKCSTCGTVAELDEQGFYCYKCLDDGHHSVVDNGWEFDTALAKYHAALREEKGQA